MVNQKDMLKEAFGKMLDHYAPLFAEYGVLLSFHFWDFREYYPDARSPKRRLFEDIAATTRRCWQRLSTGKQEPPEQYPTGGTTVKTWCVILKFRLAENKKLCKEYSFRYRQKERVKETNISVERVMGAAERVICRKLRQLQEKDARAVCTDTYWDVARYVFGHYRYKQTALGLDLQLLQFIMAVLVIVLCGIICCL